ncbi:DNAJ family-like protein [Leptomonas pyrrhocoris]|uniref:DNAJ family-like protein n=1 Tax=Leptomonas pyrrhocoris TaxID=157538 RepID=A0A0N0DYM9_LEPPY|nr:DNAJ family-like protein [Leptomonas pyrrhocoris]XP_015662786.1 DNAJ family-like protein [Leptomonas pyrrhocoris]XP_015662787.1 DNAJ family-like protein [Leptomonas pyrrhocoris]XP_015662788.1 DNAJ family-like protein [Leptomonas pyrrhocoris]KPA84346.1 DNAJ family-like protein [Leptomonas pyrrhocoris]KPA84347.1 DNAJ family-like protein [Leptomonas pyrrhocoris]KPA84348.1 DNAJ family-like protein [Leptomonas pyrrhocoris]KPA84349.1 DNAJ family-like protein [Leptomonas pyrrhocoris]|eukprot:XP_015662785.1 DNAJ family-like protein [Leptomonas pyrrhocoris]
MSSGTTNGDATAATTGSSGSHSDSNGSASPHITKENIDSFNYFQLFGLTLPVDSASSSAADDVDVATIRRVYRRLSLRFHPDKDDSAEARHAFEVVHTALETVIDAAKRAVYLNDLSDADGKQKRSSKTTDEDARQRQRTQQAQEEAQWAADLLAQREQQRRAKEAAARQAAQEREEAAQRLLSELTSTLHTPFQQMEAELVRDWDVDEEIVAMKTKEVMKLLRQLAPAGHASDSEESADGDAAEVNAGSSRKRGRETAEKL